MLVLDWKEDAFLERKSYSARHHSFDVRLVPAVVYVQEKRDTFWFAISLPHSVDAMCVLHGRRCPRGSKAVRSCGIMTSATFW
jgi:hypothetical protein